MRMRVTSASLCIVLPLAAACSGDRAVKPGPATECAAGVGTPITLGVGGYLALDPATDSGCVRFAANASASESTEYLVVPQSAAGISGQSSPFQLRGGAAAAAARLIPATMQTGTVAVQFDLFLRRLAQTRAYVRVPATAAASRSSTPIVAGPPVPGSLRSFKVCANLTCSSLKTVAARAQIVGAHIAIYIDTLAPAAGLDSADLDTLKQDFDTRLYPLDTTTFGGVSDIDSNSVAIVLMTGAVNALVTRTQCRTSGFIAGFFFGADLDPAFAAQYNHGEVFYSIVADPDSTLSCAHSAAQVKLLTPLTFTHEFQHMISFVQHVLVQGGEPEEGWLDEGLSKYAEELAARSYLPGDPARFSRYAVEDLYDGYQYLAAPGASALLIPQDNGTLANVGASWLFTRYLVDQFGDSLPRKLHQTALVGAANVAAQTGQPFTTLVTRWALANWVSDLPGFTPPPELQYGSWQFRTTYASLNAQDPTDFPQPFPLVPAAGAGAAVNLSGTLRSGSGVFQRVLQAPGGAGFTLSFTANGTTPIPSAVVARLGIIRIR